MLLSEGSISLLARFYGPISARYPNASERASVWNFSDFIPAGTEGQDYLLKYQEKSLGLSSDLNQLNIFSRFPVSLCETLIALFKPLAPDGQRPAKRGVSGFVAQIR
jgi:hypothetical protein